MYHGEDDQEDFLVLAGECLLLIEGEERQLKQWDFVHCPPWTEHVFVGAGDGPCALLAVGTRPARDVICTRAPTSRSVTTLASSRRHASPDEAYADIRRRRRARLPRRLAPGPLTELDPVPERPDNGSSHRPALAVLGPGDALQFDRRAISVGAGLLAAIPVAAVLAIGTVAWSAVAGVTMGAGAMLSGSPGGSAAAARRWRCSRSTRWLMSISTFVGCVTGIARRGCTSACWPCGRWRAVCS